jgi:predicted permease
VLTSVTKGSLSLMKLSLRFRSLIHRSAAERDLDDEFSFHLQHAIEENIARGMSRDEAILAATRAFGFVPLEKERCRDARKLGSFDDLRQDLAYGARNLIRHPGFTAVALLSLGLGIGATSAMFSLVNAVVLHGIPFPQSDQVVVIHEKKHGASAGGNPSRFRDFSEQLTNFSALTGFYSDNATLLAGGEPRKIGVMRVTGQYFTVTGIAPAEGRAFTANELSQGAPVAVISHTLARTAGQTLNLSGKLYTVIGVMPPGDPVLDDVDVWTPMPLDILATTRRAGFLAEVGRLATGSSLNRAQSEITSLAHRLSLAHPDTDQGLTAEIYPLRDELLRNAKTSMLLLSATVGFVLLIACVNIAGMLLSRSASRLRESAIRVALGAGRARLLRMFLTESVLLSLLGGVIGFGFVPLILPLLRLMLPDDLPALATAHADFTAAALTFAVALLCGLLAGCAPAWQLSSASPLSAMKEGGLTVSRMRLRRLLVVSEIAISVVLLAGAGLLARSFAALISQPLGFQPEQAIAVNVSFPWDTSPARLESFYTAALNRLSALNGVRAAGLIDRLPLSGGSQSTHMVLRDQPLPANAPFEEVSLRTVRGQYFAAIGTPMLAGVPLADRAPQDTLRKTVVNQTLARRYFGSQNPIGRFVKFDSHEYQISGVVADIRQSTTKDIPPEAYILPRDTYWPELSIVLRASGDRLALASAARAAIHQIDPDQPIDSIETLDSHVKKSTAKQALHAWLLGGFATLALLLAAIGVYGLMASDVAQRTREIGLRVALGADHRGVLGLIVRGGMTLAVAGAAVGTVATWILSRFLQSILFGIGATDIVAFSGAIALVLAVAAVAILIPAARALKLDPVAILRHE